MNQQESLNSAINEGVKLQAYNPRWPSVFETERGRLLAKFPGQFVAIEHFGSTSIPELAAKPVIDILVGVESMVHADELIEPLCREKYVTSMEFNATLLHRRWLMRYHNGHRTHHLHLVVHDGREWQQRLHFRDRLRADAKLAKRYETHKRELAQQFRSDRETYTQAKSAFVQAVIEGGL